MRLGWYLRRARRMSPAEVSGRLLMLARQTYWANPARRPGGLDTVKRGSWSATVRLAPGRQFEGMPAALAAIRAADALLGGEWPIFHLQPAPVGLIPNWFRDPLTGTAAPREDYAFSIQFRDESKVGNIKYLWEMSRHQAITVLAAAWWLTGNPTYAERAAQHLTSWWQENPFLLGVHWTSGIEVGLRLLSWTWIRALLSDWAGVRTLFDDNDLFVRQLYHHQLYVRTLHSRGSSANNHVIAELAGLASASVAFPWFGESERWAKWSRVRLVRQASLQTHPDGFNREQASEYHVFVLEMLIAAALPSRMAGRPLPEALDAVIRRMADAHAASLDATGQPPRFGDGDQGRGVLLDSPHASHDMVVLDAAKAMVGATSWWPECGPSVLGQVAALVAHIPAAARDDERPSTFLDVGMTILRAGVGADEIWARCDAGPHGFLSIAAHGHADALSLELRCGGASILVDPGTYCYHGESSWRGYFKGTQSHNTLTIDDVDQAVNAGPFLWLTRPVSRLAHHNAELDNRVQSWQASHDGYRRLADPVTHHRRVELDRATREVVIDDWIEAAAPHAGLLTFHLHPTVDVKLDGRIAQLLWPAGRAVMTLPPELAWDLRRGQTSPPLGWYSAEFGLKIPTYVLVGRGQLSSEIRLRTACKFIPSS